MTKKIKVSELKEFDIAEYLTNDAEIAEYPGSIPGSASI